MPFLHDLTLARIVPAAIGVLLTVVFVVWRTLAERRQRRVFGDATYNACRRVTGDVAAHAGRILRMRGFRFVLISGAIGILLFKTQMSAGWALGVVAMFTTALSHWGQELIPGSILVLGASRREQIDLQVAIRQAVFPFRPVSLLQTEELMTDVKIHGDCFRVDRGLHWLDAIQRFCEAFPIIVLDVRQMTGFVKDEIDHIVAAQYLYKTIVIGPGEAQTLLEDTIRKPGSARVLADLAAVPTEQEAIRLMRRLLFEHAKAPTPATPVVAVLNSWAGVADQPPAPGAVSDDAGGWRGVTVSPAKLAGFSYSAPAGWETSVLTNKADQYAVLCRPPDEQGFGKHKSRLDFMVFRYPEATAPDEAGFRRATEKNLKDRSAVITREKLGTRLGVRSHEVFFQRGPTVGFLSRFIAGHNEFLVHWSSVDPDAMQRHLPLVEAFIERVRLT
jgi:hypothetical protein